MPDAALGLIVVVAVSAAIAVALVIAIFLPLRWLVAKTRAGAWFGRDAWRGVVTRTGVVLYAALVLALLFGFAQVHLAPTSWFGTQMATWWGRLGWLAVCVAFEWMIATALARIGYPCVRPPHRNIDGGAADSSFT